MCLCNADYRRDNFFRSTLNYSRLINRAPSLDRSDWFSEVIYKRRRPATYSSCFERMRLKEVSIHYHIHICIHILPKTYFYFNISVFENTFYLYGLVDPNSSPYTLSWTITAIYSSLMQIESPRYRICCARLERRKRSTKKILLKGVYKHQNCTCRANKNSSSC